VSNKQRRQPKPLSARPQQRPAPEIDPATLDRLLASYQDLSDFFQRQGQFTPFLLRKEAMRRIEQITGRPLICYAARTHNIPQGAPAHIDDGDVVGFSDLVQLVPGDALDVLIMSNGGSAEASERIVRILRDRFSDIRFVVPGNAYSAATLICLSGDQILMDPYATLGPIDPQINGIPARAILRAFETLEERLKTEGPKALTAYMPLISKYDLHVLEICKSAQDLSRELAIQYISKYMLKCAPDAPRVQDIVAFLSDYDIHKSHGRSIDRATADLKGLAVVKTESTVGLEELVRSLGNQYLHWFDKTNFYKVFEDPRGIGWGRQHQSIAVPITGMPVPARPGPPQPSR
jgi:hypothetical protein